MNNEFNMEFPSKAEAELALKQGGYEYQTMLGVWSRFGLPLAAEVVQGDWQNAPWFVTFILFK